MSSLTIIGELLSFAGFAERVDRVAVDGFRSHITCNFSIMVNLATPKKMCGFGSSFLRGRHNVRL